ncbi:MAG: hypothetical protein V3T23_07495 [Nitrososphaerales archaeon]
MEEQFKQHLIDRLKDDDGLAEQVHKILNALDTAHLCGKAIILPKNEQCPIVVISFDRELKDTIEKQLAEHDKQPPWKQ